MTLRPEQSQTSDDSYSSKPALSLPSGSAGCLWRGMNAGGEVTLSDVRLVNNLAGSLRRQNLYSYAFDPTEVVSDGFYGLAIAARRLREVPEPDADQRDLYVSGRVWSAMIDGVRRRGGRTHAGEGPGFRLAFERSMSRLDAPIEHGDSDRLSLHSLIPDPRVRGALTEIEVDDLIARLPERRAEIVRRYLLEGETQVTIAESMRVTPSRVSQILAQSLSALRAMLADGNSTISVVSTPEPTPGPPEQRKSTAASTRPGPLSIRELEVLRWTARGHSTTQIAKALFLSEETIKSHRRHILAKLNAVNTVHAVALAYEIGLLGQTLT